MSKLTEAKLTLCDDMTALVEGLDTETAKAFIQWLDKLRLDGAHHFEFWQEEAEFIYCMED